ncbi:hypothetical protein E2493_17135 [Sphingomonas parva]|uniref:Uncharacterized protein n=1 Tax=Sphingomonas parva TaxID=2555898 RepID=A0A4Y8ZQA7_9SPHN|nr:DUF6665 family protein [Sphingomonas parva]TFI57019.1 hypothetical protein E2493_17135 [Sphingomonas parva]
MSFRPPSSISATPSPRDLAGLELDILAEKAGTLGQAGRLMEQKLAALRAAEPDQEGRDALRREAADAVQAYFIQREACGIRRHQDAIAEYRIPSEVLARLGAR